MEGCADTGPLVQYFVELGLRRFTVACPTRDALLLAFVNTKLNPWIHEVKARLPLPAGVWLLSEAAQRQNIGGGYGGTSVRREPLRPNRGRRRLQGWKVGYSRQRKASVILQRLSISPSLSFQKIGGRH